MPGAGRGETAPGGGIGRGRSAGEGPQERRRAAARRRAGTWAARRAAAAAAGRCFSGGAGRRCAPLRPRPCAAGTPACRAHRGCSRSRRAGLRGRARSGMCDAAPGRDRGRARRPRARALRIAAARAHATCGRGAAAPRRPGGLPRRSAHHPPARRPSWRWPRRAGGSRPCACAMSAGGGGGRQARRGRCQEWEPAGSALSRFARARERRGRDGPGRGGAAAGRTGDFCTCSTTVASSSRLNGASLLTLRACSGGSFPASASRPAARPGRPPDRPRGAGGRGEPIRGGAGARGGRPGRPAGGGMSRRLRTAPGPAPAAAASAAPRAHLAYVAVVIYAAGVPRTIRWVLGAVAAVVGICVLSRAGAVAGTWGGRALRRGEVAGLDRRGAAVR